MDTGKCCLAGESLGLEGKIAQQLLPGIPDEVTLAAIATKLSWREVHLLQSVSKGWYSAIRDRQVYDARVHYHLTETFVLLAYSNRSGNRSLALRCLRDNSYFELPEISHHDVRNPSGGFLRFVAVDGKLFVLGGTVGGPSDKVYMLDLAAGQSSWTQVASMHVARSTFACGVMGGKIYVCGGTSFQYVDESEVYDPKENMWSLIKPMCSLTWSGNSGPVGEELFVYDAVDDKHTVVVEAYNPVKDEWRKIEPFDQLSSGIIFVSRGRIYSLKDVGIWEYSFEGNSWTQVCSNSFTAIQSAYPVNFVANTVLAVDNSLIAFGSLSTDLFSPIRLALLRSIGFDTEKEELEWREETGWGGGWGTQQLINCWLPVHL